MSRVSTNILLVDDHPLLRRGLRQLLDMDPTLEIIGEAGDGGQALALALELKPDLILLDLNMRGMTGLETLLALRKAGITTRVVILTVSNSDEDVVAALRAGADGYLLKDMEPEELLAQIQRATCGHVVISPELGACMARALQGAVKADNHQPAQLTPREQQILKGITRGLSNKLIARELDITEGTAKVHVKHMLKKLGLRTRVEAAIWALTQAQPPLNKRHG